MQSVLLHIADKCTDVADKCSVFRSKRMRCVNEKENECTGRPRCWQFAPVIIMPSFKMMGSLFSLNLNARYIFCLRNCILQF